MYTTKKRTYYVLGTIVLILSTVLSCKKATVKEVLTDDSYCYWHYIAGRATTDTMNYYGCCREESVYMYFTSLKIVFNLMGAKSILANLMDTTTNTFRHGILQKIAFLT